MRNPVPTSDPIKPFLEASFDIREELRDFLPRSARSGKIRRSFRWSPSVKDAVEGMGIPHPEIDLIIVNGVSVDFSYRLRSGDEISVYPARTVLEVETLIRLQAIPPSPPTFVADVHLGKLVRRLRLLGIDTTYRNDFDDPEIVDCSVRENRIILTRDIHLLKTGRVRFGYWVRSVDPSRQIGEVVRRFDVGPHANPFTRCLECNGFIEVRPKESVRGLVPPHVAKIQTEFFACGACGRIYWKGSHFEGMKNILLEAGSGNGALESEINSLLKEV